MTEFIPYIPEHDTSEERFAWDEILRALATLSEYDDELDVHEAIHDLKDELLEDGYMMVFNYAVNVTVPEGESSELDQVVELLQDNGMMEGRG